MQKRPRGKSDCHCINLRRAANAVTALYDRTLVPCGLTLNQYSLLGNLNRLGRSNVSDLAAKMGLERTTLVRNLRPLLAKGYVQDDSPKGVRDRWLGVSPSGLAALEKGKPLWAQAQADFQEAIGGENIPILIGFLEALEHL